MKNKITSIATTSKKKVGFASMALALSLVTILSVTTLPAFAAERPQPRPDRPIQNSEWRVPDEWIVSPELLERLQESEAVTLFDPSQAPSLDAFGERVNVGGMDIFRINSEGLPNVINLDAFAGIYGMEVLVFEGIESPPRTFSIGSPNFEQVPLVGASGEIHMVSQMFLDMILAMDYEEFSAFAELLSTMVMFQTQEPIPVDILREHWLAAQ